MAMGRGAYTTISTSTSAPTQRSQDKRSEKPTTLRTTEYRPLRSPIDSSTALWNEGRRKRIIELEAQLRRDDSQRRLEERNQRKEAGGAERQSHQSRQSTTRESRVSSKTNEKGRRETTGPAAAGESSDGETENRSDRYRRREGGTSLSPGTASNVGLSLEQRLGLWERGWRPPRLRELPRGGEGFFSGWTHLGQPERFELVKSTNRSLGSHDAELTDAELEWAVLSLEDAEERMDSLQFSEAANVLENVLIRCPSLTLAYYRLALCLLAARGMHASKQAMRLLDCAMFLEGAGNPHLASAVDLILRMLRNDFIPEELWSEDHPKSLGDLRALEAALDHFM